MHGINYTRILILLMTGTAIVCGYGQNQSASPTPYQESMDPLAKEVSEFFSYKNFDEALEQLRITTRCTFFCPEELAAFMRTIWLGTSRGLSPNATSEQRLALTSEREPMRKFLDIFCEGLSLQWKYHPDKNELTLEPSWKVPDSGNPYYLLHHATTLFDKSWKQVPYYQKHQAWDESFHALLSNHQNYDKAWRVKQKSDLQGFHLAHLPENPIFMQPMKSISGKPYILVITCNPIFMYPGHGSIACYCFTEEGLLMGADLLNTGWRCNLVDISTAKLIHDEKTIGSSLNFLLKFNDRDPFIAHFQMQDNGLKLIGFSDAEGQPLPANYFLPSLGVGESLMKPDIPLESLIKLQNRISLPTNPIGNFNMPSGT